MPQELQVVRCFDCKFFQVHIVKKISKWVCKMCGQKQSLKKVYFFGSGKECREAVQKLNKDCLENKMTLQVTVDNQDLSEYEEDISGNEEDLINQQEEFVEKEIYGIKVTSGKKENTINNITEPKASKWDLFIEQEEAPKLPEISEHIDVEKLTFERPEEEKGLKRKRNSSSIVKTTNNHGVVPNKWDSYLSDPTNDNLAYD